MSSKPWDVVIVGSGFGGLTCGALLTNEGKRVLLLEREDRLGGRATSIKGEELSLPYFENLLKSTGNEWIVRTEPDISEIVDKQLLKGFTLDLGFHEYVYHENGRVGILLKNFGEAIKFYPLQENYYWFDNKWCGMAPPKIEFIPDELMSEFGKVAKGNMKMFPKDTAQFDHVSIKEFIEERTDKKRIQDFWYLLATLVTTINHPKDISAGETIRSSNPVGYTGGHAGSGNGGSVEGGFITVANKLAKIIKDSGGVVRTQTEVNKIIVEDGEVKGVEVSTPTGEETIEAKVVVSNVPIQKSFKILDENVFPSDWVKHVKGLRSAGSASGYIALNTRVLKNRGWFGVMELIPEGEGFRGAVRCIFEGLSNYDPTRAPEDKQLVTFYAPLTQEEANNKKKVNKVIDALNEFLDERFPEYHESVEWAIYTSLDYLDGVARSPDQVGNKRPEIKAPGVKGLYFVGDGVRSWGVPMDATVHSGFIAAGMIAKKDCLQMLPEYLR
ncbi:MAG: phytoene desaturase family protein [Candidatus Jordarchaeum sp.]|uniref:phytoene desaturase family protein n=1 Tax=Candidatus Jordarchaeum sp. TaxID=2823881 RepID=UPI00404AF909